MGKIRNETIFDRPGQTCNRLWSWLDSAGKAIANGTRLRIIFWDRETRHFSNLRESSNVSFPFYSPFMEEHFRWYREIVFWFFGTRAIKWIFRHLGEERGFVEGWKRRDSHEWFPQVKEEITELFRPDKEITEEVEEAFGKRRENGFLIIGVHIRRGDYKEWEGGKYYLDNADYAERMREVGRLFPDHRICFFISSNEPVRKSDFEGLDLMETGFTTPVHDLYGLSLCDRIIGPLSTFSRWASFYGRVPLCFIGKDTPIDSDEDFSPIEHFYRFENGKEIPNLTDKRKEDCR